MGDKVKRAPRGYGKISKEMCLDQPTETNKQKGKTKMTKLTLPTIEFYKLFFFSKSYIEYLH